MNDEILIHIQIADKKYPVWLKRSDEYIARKAAKQIQTLIDQRRQQYDPKKVSEWDALAMVALQLSIENLQLEEKNDTTPFTAKITELTGEITDYLKENKL